MLGDVAPFRLAGNIYFVGTHKASSHMIDTGDGMMLIDTGYEETVDIIVKSVADLGFDIKDLKCILISHGHSDHSDGAARLKALTGANIYMHEADMKYIKGFVPDVLVRDGDVISLGNTSVRCLHTPGHTEGTLSFFFDTEEDGKLYRAAMFGGTSANQLKKPYMDRADRNVWYGMRGEFYKSIERLRGEHVDIFLGNHTWNNDTEGTRARSLAEGKNLFIDDSKWLAFLDSCEKHLDSVIADEISTQFVNYAHRGASEYLPENTLLAFYTGIYMGANGIETDVRLTKDGVMILFHDDTIDRVTDASGKVEDYTYDELREFFVNKNGYCDKIVKFEDFLERFCFRDITFAIELKGPGVEKGTADLIRKYNMERKVVVTSFEFDYIKRIKEYAPELRVGYLTGDADDEIIARLKAIKADEICPKAVNITAEKVDAWHREGFRVRAWGVGNEELMKKAYDAGVDGMTVNFPDKLSAYIKEENAGE